MKQKKLWGKRTRVVAQMVITKEVKESIKTNRNSKQDMSATEIRTSMDG